MLSKGQFAVKGVLLCSKRTGRNPLGESAGGRIVGMVLINDRLDAFGDRRCRLVEG